MNKIEALDVPVSPHYEESVDFCIEEIVRYFHGNDIEKQAIRKLIKTAVTIERMSRNAKEMEYWKKKIFGMEPILYQMTDKEFRENYIPTTNSVVEKGKE